MKKDDAEEYTQSLGQIVAGSWRQIALAKRLGVPKAMGLSVDEWVNNRLGGYIKMSIDERREAVKELAEEGDSTREIADVLGVNNATVSRDLAVANATPDDKEAEEKQEVTGEAVANASPEPIDAIAALSATDAVRAKAEENIHVSNNSGENEWYTPVKYIDAAKAVMGYIDMDPASSDLANETVGAQTIFTADDDGLGKDWNGKVWMNPPYAQPLITQFTEKLGDSYESGSVSQAIALVNNATDTGWFQALANHASAICFPDKRIRFIDKNGNPSGAPLQGQAILYLGKNGNDFANAFNKFGFVMTHV